MKDKEKEGSFRKSRRNFSDINEKFTYPQNLQDPYRDAKVMRPKQNSIKITRGKLPPDFFPRTQSLRKKVFSTRQSVHEDKNDALEYYRKAESENNDISPEKTSFFGFFEQKSRQKKKMVNMFSSKRQFESRDEPKRQKAYAQVRNFTPMNGSHRAGLLEMYPSVQDEVVYEALAGSKKMKDLQISPRKQPTRKVHHLQLQDPEKLDDRKQNMQQMFNIGPSEDAHNVTFFNAKSTILPPIFKN